MAAQGVVITDPHLIAEVLQSKDFEKDVRTYRTLDSVRLLSCCCHATPLGHMIPARLLAEDKSAIANEGMKSHEMLLSFTVMWCEIISL